MHIDAMINMLRIHPEHIEAWALDQIADMLEAQQREIKAMRQAAAEALALSGLYECRICKHTNGEHAEDCPMHPVADIVCMPIDWQTYGQPYLRTPECLRDACDA